MARSTMARLISRVRGLSYAGTAEYTIGADSYFSDDHVQTFLDACRRDVVRAPLVDREEYNGSGVRVFRTFDTGLRELESTDAGTAVFKIETSDGFTAGTALWSADYQTGVVTFASNTAGTAYYLTARAYDVYGAAADLLEAWASREARQFDVSTPAVNAKRSQKAAMLREQAMILRAQGGSGGGVDMYRSDATEGY